MWLFCHSSVRTSRSIFNNAVFSHYYSIVHGSPVTISVFVFFLVIFSIQYLKTILILYFFIRTPFISFFQGLILFTFCQLQYLLVFVRFCSGLSFMLCINICLFFSFLSIYSILRSLCIGCRWYTTSRPIYGSRFFQSICTRSNLKAIYIYIYMYKTDASMVFMWSAYFEVASWISYWEKNEKHSWYRLCNKRWEFSFTKIISCFYNHAGKAV